MSETWKPVVGWEEFYEISDLGRVRSLDRVTGGPFGSQRVTRGRLLKPSKVKGYWHVCLKDKRTFKNEYIHRLVLLAFVGEPKPDQQGCHNNGNRLDNRLVNLRWDTLQANKIDMVRHGTSTKGARNPMAKFSQGVVNAMREERRTKGSSYSVLAKKYGMSMSNAHAICTGKLWA